MSIATITASEILAGKQGDPDTFSIAHFDIAEADDRIDALISSDHYRPHYMGVDMWAVWYRLLATSFEAACQLATKEAIPHITLMQCNE